MNKERIRGLLLHILTGRRRAAAYADAHDLAGLNNRPRRRRLIGYDDGEGCVAKAGLQEQASNKHKLRWSKARQEIGADLARGRQVKRRHGETRRGSAGARTYGLRAKPQVGF